MAQKVCGRLICKNGTQSFFQQSKSLLATISKSRNFNEKLTPEDMKTEWYQDARKTDRRLFCSFTVGMALFGALASGYGEYRDSEYTRQRYAEGRSHYITEYMMMGMMGGGFMGFIQGIVYPHPMLYLAFIASASTFCFGPMLIDRTYRLLNTNNKK